MDQILQAQFQRVETALATLVDSIAAYNPLPQAAVDLIAADDDLCRGLDQLAQHHANNARILALRAEAEALELQLKSRVATLASLRRELAETPATVFPNVSRPVPFDELLQFAKNISQQTVPPTYRERLPEPPKPELDGRAPEPGSSGPTPNPANTPLLDVAKDDVPAEIQGVKAITPEEAEWLKTLKERGFNWVPWPDHDKIRRSNLMQIQYLLDTNQDPTQVDATKMGDAEKEMIVAEAEKQAAAQALDVSATQQIPSRPAAPSRPSPDEPKFAGFDFTD